MNKTNFKIAEQSKVALENALLKVMEQYDFKEITITQITQEANLSRKTFYRWFSYKEDVITAYYEHLFQEWLDKTKPQQIQHYWDVVQAYFDFWEDRRSLLLLLKRNGLLSLLFEYTYKHSIEVFESVRSTEIKSSFSRLLPFMLAYSIGGMHSMLLKWVENNMDVPSSLLVEKLKLGFMSDDI